SVAGKFDESRALAMIAFAFGSIPKPARALPKTYTVEPTQDGERDVTLRRTGDTQAILAVYHIPAATSPDMPALDLLAAVIGDAPRVAKAYLKSSNRTVGVFVPTAQPDRAEIPAAPDSADLLKDFKGPEAVATGEAFDPTPANIEGRVSRAPLPGGLKVVLLPK